MKRRSKIAKDDRMTKGFQKWSYSFVFSSSLLDWMFAPKTTGNERKKKYEKELRDKSELTGDLSTIGGYYEGQDTDEQTCEEYGAKY